MISSNPLTYMRYTWSCWPLMACPSYFNFPSGNIAAGMKTEYKLIRIRKGKLAINISLKKEFLKGHITFCLNASNPKCIRCKQNKVILIRYR